jgi:hypothetical protein
MNNQKNNNVEKLDVESLIVDLLACGLGACIILFFIFSIKIIGKTTIQTTQSNQERKIGKGSGYVSLIGDNGDPKKRMCSIRIIEFSKLSPDNFNVLKKYVSSNTTDFDFWNEFKGFKSSGREDTLFSSIKTQIQIHRANISFVLYADGMREFEFSFPENLRNQFENSRDINAIVKVFAIEGKSMKGDFNGNFESIPYEIKNLKEFDLKFKVGKATHIDKLIKINGIK